MVAVKQEQPEKKLLEILTTTDCPFILTSHGVVASDVRCVSKHQNEVEVFLDVLETEGDSAEIKLKESSRTVLGQ